MADRFLGRRLIATARLARYEREIEAAIRRALARRRGAVDERAALTAAVKHPDPFDEDAWDTDLIEEVEPVVHAMLANLNAGIVKQFPLGADGSARVLGLIDVRAQAETFMRLVRGIGPDVAGRINDALAVGVSKGEGIVELAARVSDVFAMADRRAATISRTETNRAANAGSIDAAGVIAQEMAVMKTWLATADDRTRDDHLDADGQTVNFDEMFDVGGEQAEYPCDPNLSAENSINCRCTVIFDVPEDVSPEQQAELESSAE